MPAERRTAPLADFVAITRADSEAREFVAVLGRFRDVQPGGAPTRLTAQCPAVPWHRIVIEQTPGGAKYTCDRCAVTPARMARLGTALARLLGYARLDDARAQ